MSCLVLVWGLFRFRLLGTRPIARGLVFETISEAVVVLDPLHRVVDANPPAERLLGLSVADATGRPLAELLPEAADAVRQPATGGNGLPEEPVVTRAGTTRRYEPTVLAMPDRQRPPIGWLLVLRDVTEHHWTVHRNLRICGRVAVDASPFLLRRRQFHQTVAGLASSARSTGVYRVSEELPATHAHDGQARPESWPRCDPGRSPARTPGK